MSDESRCPCGQTIAECDANEIEHLRARYDALQAKVSEALTTVDEMRMGTITPGNAATKLTAILSDTSTEGDGT